MKALLDVDPDASLDTCTNSCLPRGKHQKLLLDGLGLVIPDREPVDRLRGVKN